MSERPAVMRRLTRLLPLLAIVGLLVWLAAPHIAWYGKSDIEKIRWAVESMVEGGRQRHVGAVTTHVSEQYAGDGFHQNKDELVRTLQQFFFRFRSIDVRLGEIRVTLAPEHPDTATALFRAEILASPEPNVKPTHAVVKDFRGTDGFRLEFRREGSVWRVIRCERVSENDLPQT